ncbi:uncharacterized protein PV07_11069 [Cladophialophora immunda]|uniref:Transcription factor domain-containing protein n=1 Tax=Cladophialophora immunda TaxID=569365 RepID=A0A0D2BUR6_9EURO|nr:uncharacterized protein PV07_11069 [Cladophialophora immunda]KIW22808.1 hypothetical protein PV07_11069 [Cladophialophora immunda]
MSASDFTLPRHPGVPDETNGSSVTTPKSCNPSSRFDARIKHGSQTLSMDIQLCGYHLDHIESYGGRERVRVLHCLDYYANFCGPNYVWRNEAIATGSIQHFAQDFFQLSLATPALLETVLAICQADLDLRHQSCRTPSMRVLQHLTTALGLLQQRILSADLTDDKSIAATIVGLITIDTIFEDWPSYHVHLKYLRALLVLRGGAESLGWQGWFAYAYSWAELRWAAQLAHKAMADTTESFPGDQFEDDVRPLHADYFLPREELPMGFQELVDLGLLHGSIVGLLEKTAGWVSCTVSDYNGLSPGGLNIRGLALARDFASIIHSCPESQLEVLLCIAMVAYIISLIEGPGGHSRGLEDLTANLQLFDLRTFDMPFRLWAASAVAAANPTVPSPLPHRWTLIDQVMTLGVSVETWPEAVTVFNKFFFCQHDEKQWENCWNAALARNASYTS